MVGIQRWIKKNDYILVFSLLSVLTYVALYSGRSLDDNRLTNWQWAFAGLNALKVCFILVLGLIAAGVLSRFSFIERYPCIFLFAFSYAICILFWATPEVIVDASRYFTQAKYLETYGMGYFLREWGREIPAWTDMPLIPFLYGLIFKFFGESRVYIQMFTTFLFSMTVVFTYLIGKTLWDETVGLFGGMLLLGIPYLFIHASVMLVDVPTMFFLVLSIFTFDRAMNRGGVWIGFSSISISLAMLSKYSAWLMLSVLIVMFLVYMISRNRQMPDVSHQEQEPPNYIMRGMIIIVISILLTGTVLLCKSDVISEQIKLLLSYQRPGLRRWEESFISTFFFQIHPFITAAAFYSIYAAFRKRDLKYLIVVWLVVIVVTLQIKRIRYIIAVFPMLTLMASYGLAGIGNRNVIKFISLCVVMFSLVIGVFIYLPFMQRISTVNLKNAGEFLDSLDESGIEVFTVFPDEPVVNPAVSVPLLDFFTEKNIYFDYNRAVTVDTDKVRTSSLRFTWEYKNPDYYKTYHTDDSAIVVISEDVEDVLPEDMRRELEGYYIARTFSSYEGVFQYRTSVRIYRKKI